MGRFPKDYSDYTDSQVEDDYNSGNTSEAEDELYRRGYDYTDDGELLDSYDYDEYLEEKKRESKNDSSVGCSGIIGFLIIAVIIILLLNGVGLWEAIKFPFMLIAYIFMTIIEIIINIFT